MARRTDEKPFRPLESSLVREVMHGNAAAAMQPSPEPVRTIELKQPMPVPEPERMAEQPVVAPQAVRQQVRPQRAPQASPFVERMEREKRVLLTPSEERAFERVVTGIAAELGTSLKSSHVLRSCIRLVINAENELIERARANGRTVRPPNGDLPAIEAFEKVIASVLQVGIRGSRQIR